MSEIIYNKSPYDYQHILRYYQIFPALLCEQFPTYKEIIKFKDIEYSTTQGIFKQTKWKFVNGTVFRLATTDPLFGKERFTLYYDSGESLRAAKRICVFVNDAFHDVFRMYHTFYIKNQDKLEKASLRIFCDNLVHAAFVRACCMYEGDHFEEPLYDRQLVIKKTKEYMNEFREIYSNQSIAVCGHTRRNTAKNFIFNFLRQTEAVFEEHLDTSYKDYKPRPFATLRTFGETDYMTKNY